jgi:hypothetical protein
MKRLFIVIVWIETIKTLELTFWLDIIRGLEIYYKFLDF